MTNFAAFILSNRRAGNVKTYKALRVGGYTGRIVIVVDDQDPTVDEYRRQFGDQVVVFDKQAISETMDQVDNFKDMRTIVYARNACFDIARRLGVRRFVQLDDDYYDFNFRFNDCLEWATKDIKIRNLDRVFAILADFHASSGALSIAMAQGGDFIGGQAGVMGSSICLKRKAMNSFFCDVDRPFQFIGRVNEDVNTYTLKASRGALFFTCNQVALNQVQTQKSDGGMSSVYRASGTYVKSFYSVICHPSGVTVQLMNSRTTPRLHHHVDWERTTPKIVRESTRKAPNE